MADQYKDLYKKEMAQVHAPLDLIERTKAAVREEEARLLKADAAQAAASGMTVHADEKRTKGSVVYKWAYPLTAAAALFILVSVSLTMKSIKGNSSGAGGAVYEESAEADAGFSEEMEMETASTAEEDGAVETASEEDAATDLQVEESALAEESEDKTFIDAKAGAAQTPEFAKAEAESLDEARSAGEEKQDLNEMKKMTEEAENILADSACAAKGILIEKAEQKPAFCDLPGTSTQIYEGRIFLVREEGSGWKAYAETAEGNGYVLQGEMEDLEEFLEAGNEELMHIENE